MSAYKIILNIFYILFVILGFYIATNKRINLNKDNLQALIIGAIGNLIGGQILIGSSLIALAILNK